MFDKILVPCPTCQTPVEFQSKRGDCFLDSYTLENATPDMLTDIARKAVRCERCETLVGVSVQVMAYPVNRDKNPIRAEQARKDATEANDNRKAGCPFVIEGWRCDLDDGHEGPHIIPTPIPTRKA